MSLQMGSMLFIPFESFSKAWFSSKIVWDSGRLSDKQTLIEEIVRFNSTQPLQLTLTGQLFISALLNQDFVIQAVTLIITRFLPLKPMDLEKWEADPEEWVLEETKDYEAWEFDIRVRLMFCVDADWLNS